MVQKKNPAAAKSTAPKEENKKAQAITKPPEAEQTTPEAVKHVEHKELSPIDKWNTAKVLLIQKFPVFQPGELDIVNCTIEDRRVHVRTKLRMTDKQIAEVIPGY